MISTLERGGYRKQQGRPAFLVSALVVAALVALPATARDGCPDGQAPAFDGSTTCLLDPASVPKYVIPLVIPPVMNNNGTTDSYDIAVRQFQQQILPGGIWNSLSGRTDKFPATTIWSYGPDADPTPVIAPDPASQFNYPAYTFETQAYQPVGVRWINDLVDASGNCLPHLLAVDQTLHWANPPQKCISGASRTDCKGRDTTPYTGPVPIVTHVHGAHVDAHSDGYPEAWWLPACNDIPASYATSGTIFDDATGTNDGDVGYADYWYRQDQPAATLWYHDHSLGMTRSNVYAGPAGFWLIRGGANDVVLDGKTGQVATLPGPAPVAGQTVLELNVPGDPVRGSIREIPIAIQDRSFNPDGSLFYPDNRAHFEDLNPEQLQIDFVPKSDIAPIWNPEAFFNTMVVNGVSWPTLEVAPAAYRFRLLNGCNSRFLQIGAEQGFLPQAVEILTGYATQLDGKGKPPKNRTAAPDPQQGLLMTLAERADVIVDFSGLRDGTVVTMINTAPDAPFGGFPDTPADPGTTGQIMQFVVNKDLRLQTDTRTTNPYRLVPAAEGDLGPAVETRTVSLNEGESEQICVEEDEHGNLVQIMGIKPPCAQGEAFAPKEALLGVLDDNGEGVPLTWTDHSGLSQPVAVTLSSGAQIVVNVTENPTVGDTELWEIHNFTEDAHPIHLHLVRFEVVERRALDGTDSGVGNDPQPWETGYKDTVIAYPGEITTVKALFDVPGLYVWHCHIVEHEDNEMMRPYVVSE
jgi:FtsP/CotA-like multicopper oxidase with cupredoxin domain